MKFEELKFGPKRDGDFTMGVQARHYFPNGYGVSVIQGPYTYGGPEGLYELAVMTEDGLCYDTPITEDVLGHLTPEEVTGLLAQVEALPTSPQKEVKS